MEEDTAARKGLGEGVRRPGGTDYGGHPSDAAEAGRGEAERWPGDFDGVLRAQVGDHGQERSDVLGPYRAAD